MLLGAVLGHSPPSSPGASSSETAAGGAPPPSRGGARQDSMKGAGMPPGSSLLEGTPPVRWRSITGEVSSEAGPESRLYQKRQRTPRMSGFSLFDKAKGFFSFWEISISLLFICW